MNVKFVGSYDKDFPKDKEHVVFVGRSNVGKSSLINMLVAKNVARVSKEPGRTRMVNLFELEGKVYLVDVPGYGYAKASKEERERWRSMMDEYFRECRDCIKRLFILVDSLVGPTDLDKVMIEWVNSMKLDYVVILTKGDKASQKEIIDTVKKIKAMTTRPIVITSSKEGRGRKEVLSYVFS